MELTVLVIVIVDGATATETDFQGRGFSSDTTSIAAFNTSIPVGFVTCTTPTYWDRITFFGSSIGVGNDWAEKKLQTLMGRFLIINVFKLKGSSQLIH